MLKGSLYFYHSYYFHRLIDLGVTDQTDVRKRNKMMDRRVSCQPNHLKSLERRDKVQANGGSPKPKRSSSLRARKNKLSLAGLSKLMPRSYPNSRTSPNSSFRRKDTNNKQKGAQKASSSSHSDIQQMLQDVAPKGPNGCADRKHISPDGRGDCIQEHETSA